MLSAKPPVQSPFLPRDRDEFRAESGWEVGTGNWTTSQIDKSPNSNYLTKILIYRERKEEETRESKRGLMILREIRLAKRDVLDKRKLVKDVG